MTKKHQPEDGTEQYFEQVQRNMLRDARKKSKTRAERQRGEWLQSEQGLKWLFPGLGKKSKKDTK